MAADDEDIQQLFCPLTDSYGSPYTDDYDEDDEVKLICSIQREVG